MNYWLFKTEPSSYSWQDLLSDKKTTWDGVRNFQARNILRDQMQEGDLAFFYHSVVKPMTIMGIVRITKTGIPDHTALEPKSKYYDIRHSIEKPLWYMVEVEPVKEFKNPITREQLKEIDSLEDMMLLKKGSRLSVQPVSEENFKTIIALEKTKIIKKR